MSTHEGSAHAASLCGTRPAEPVTPTCPRPVARPIMVQGWHNLTSVHFAYEPEVVQRLLPTGFVVDTIDGFAQVGVIPFDMDRIRIPTLPPFGRLSTFPETNVRTYLTDSRGRRGVWFFSLDVSRLVPAMVARATYGLPYCWSKMSVNAGNGVVSYESARRLPTQRGRERARCRLSVRPGPQIEPAAITAIEAFVTARWALGSTFGPLRLWAEVDHGPWPLHRAELLEFDETLLTSAGLPAPNGTPTVLWSPGVEVRIGRPRRAR